MDHVLGARIGDAHRVILIVAEDYHVHLLIAKSSTPAVRVEGTTPAMTMFSFWRPPHLKPSSDLLNVAPLLIANYAPSPQTSHHTL